MSTGRMGEKGVHKGVVVHSSVHTYYMWAVGLELKITILNISQKAFLSGSHTCRFHLLGHNTHLQVKI